MIETKIEPTFWARIYLSGPLPVAEHILREDFAENGFCVTVDPTKFVYTGGEETGYVLGLINYPRFPSTPERITQRARDLATQLLMRTYQRTALIVTPNETFWLHVE